MDLGAPACPAAIWHGGGDRVVPPAHAQWWAGALPGARLHVAEGEGHISLVGRHAPAILADLLALLEERQAAAAAAGAAAADEEAATAGAAAAGKRLKRGVSSRHRACLITSPVDSCPVCCGSRRRPGAAWARPTAELATAPPRRLQPALTVLPAQSQLTPRLTLVSRLPFCDLNFSTVRTARMQRPLTPQMSVNVAAMLTVWLCDRICAPHVAGC